MTCEEKGVRKEIFIQFIDCIAEICSMAMIDRVFGKGMGSALL